MYMYVDSEVSTFSGCYQSSVIITITTATHINGIECIYDIVYYYLHCIFKMSIFFTIGTIVRYIS